MGNQNRSEAYLRIVRLLDESSFMEVGESIDARNTDFNLGNIKAPSDGVITGHGLIEGNLVFVYSQDNSILNGTIGEMHARKIASVYGLAMKVGAPVIAMIDCGGIRLQESFDALEGLGTMFLKQSQASGVIPQIAAVFGSCGGSLTTVPALSDFCFIEETKGKLFVCPPNTIAGNRMEICDTSAPAFQSENNGFTDGIGTEEEILISIRNLICLLPGNNSSGGLSEEEACYDDLNRDCLNMEVKYTDPRAALSELSDDHIFFETRKDYEKSMVTGFIRLNGMTIGAVANGRVLLDEAGTVIETYEEGLSARGCVKASEFINFCNAFDIPILSLTNVNGFCAGKDSEAELGKAVAKLTYAFANADVPKVNLITGTAFGGAYVAMNSKSIGADLVYAWPDSKIGMMETSIAVKIIYPDLKADAIEEKAQQYDELQSGPYAAARRGHVDRIIEPAFSRKYLVAAFELLFTKSTREITRKNGTK